MASTDLTIVEPGNFPVLAHEPDDLREIIDDALGGDLLDEQSLMRVKVPSGGATTWEVGEEATKTLDGILVHFKQVRAYWEDDAEDGAPPTCSSEGPDHVAIGKGKPGGKCAECPLAQFGTAVNEDGTPGNGQACGKNELWFMLRSEGAGSFLPIVVKLPPTSLKPAKNYRTGTLAGAGLMKTSVVTRLTLAKQDRGNESYAVIVPSIAGHLAPEEAERAKQFAREMKGTFEAVAAAEAAGGVTVELEPEVAPKAKTTTASAASSEE